MVPVFQMRRQSSRDVCSDVVEDSGPVLDRAGNQTQARLGSKSVPPAPLPLPPSDISWFTGLGLFCFEAGIVLSGLQFSSGLWKKITFITTQVTFKF